MEFFKYQGAGNDFILVDNRAGLFQVDKNLSTESIEKMCDRNFGIGADGLILLEEDSVTDFAMVYFNSDGNESTMCGNGGRCIVAFAKYLNVFSDSSCTFKAIDGLHAAKLSGDLVELQMIDVQQIEEIGDDFFLDTGSPHYVSFVENVDTMDLISAAKAIRYNDRFKAVGTNVNFVSVADDYLSVRTYERGVEGETLACGTGVTAVALVAHLKGKNTNDCSSRIQVKGGELVVAYSKEDTGFSNIWLKGPAEQVFSGDYVIEV